MDDHRQLEKPNKQKKNKRTGTIIVYIVLKSSSTETATFGQFKT